MGSSTSLSGVEVGRCRHGHQREASISASVHVVNGVLSFCFGATFLGLLVGEGMGMGMTQKNIHGKSSFAGGGREIRTNVRGASCTVLGRVLSLLYFPLSYAALALDLRELLYESRIDGRRPHRWT